MASIELKALRKTYAGGLEAVKGVELTIGDGEFVVLVGPSGCGKSTLLRMVAGLERVTFGEILIDGRRVNDVEPADRDIAMVFQNYALYPHMTVYQNLAYGLRNRGTPKAEIERRVREAAAILEIGGLLERKPRQLSGGQRQRVAMGRAIVREPKVFLFDEPLSNLDAKLRVSMRGEIKQLQRRLGTTSLYVTHDQLEAMTLADRLVVLSAGRIEQVGTPLEVYHAPASTFVAAFIGAPAMNLVDGRAVGGRIVVGSADIAADGLGFGERPVTIGIRAEDLHPARPELPALRLSVRYVEELGAQRLVHGSLGGQHLTAALSPEVPIADEIALSVAAERLHFFDKDSGRRLPAA